MALTITITDPKLIEMIQQKAEEAGVSQSEAVEIVLRDAFSENVYIDRRMPPLLTPEYKGAREAQVMATLAEIHTIVRRQDRFEDYDARFYDWAGLPR